MDKALTDIENHQVEDEHKSNRYIKNRIEVLRYSIKITTSLCTKIILEQELEGLVNTLNSR